MPLRTALRRRFLLDFVFHINADMSQRVMGVLEDIFTERTAGESCLGVVKQFESR